MAAEAAGGFHVAQIAGIGAPVHLHLRKDIVGVGFAEQLAGAFDGRLAGRIHIRIVLLVVVAKRLRDLRNRFFATRVAGLQHRYGLLLGEGPIR